MSSVSRSPRLAAPILVGAAAVFALTACAPAAPAAEDPVAQEPFPASDPSELVDEVCLEAYPLSALAPADIDALTLMPADWPAPPDDAVLCATSESDGEGIDGAPYTIQDADYASSASIDSVLAHYEGALGSHELVRTDGAESGTGYAALDGTVGEIGFQIRETDGGFTVLLSDGY
jgi:hypothetical protein